jgi:hypothetical protein
MKHNHPREISCLGGLIEGDHGDVNTGWRIEPTRNTSFDEYLHVRGVGSGAIGWDGAQFTWKDLSN